MDEADKQLQRALQLEKQGDTFDAITEYERFLFFLPHHDKAPLALYRLVICRDKMGEWKKVVSSAKLFLHKYPNKPIGVHVKMLLAKSLVRLGKVKEARSILEELKHDGRASPWSDEISALIGECYLLEGNLEKAKYAAGKEYEESEIPRKSPLEAGIGAAILPGLGHLYNNRPRDTWTALFYTGMFSAIAWEAYENDHPWLTGLFGLAGATFYTGDIFSAANVTYKSNRRKEIEYLNNILSSRVEDFSIGLREVIPKARSEKREGISKMKEKKKKSPFSWMFLAGIAAFRKFVSPIDNRTCPSYPSCSSYGLQAFKSYGPFWGAMLTTDRLIHEPSEGKYAPFIIINGRKKIYDPLDANVFLLNRPVK